MKNYAVTFALALCVVLAALTLRQGLSAVAGSSDSWVATSIGASPVPAPTASPVASIGGAPVPLPPNAASIGGAPVPLPPNVVTS